MMAGMRHNDVTDDLQDGFELGPVPAVGADGVPVVPPMRRPVPARPRLCEAGPCLNYHRFEIQLDAEDPRGRKVAATLPGIPGVQHVPGGSVYAAPAAFHVESHHYCYPTVGVEMRLGSLPVLHCNRWHPMMPGSPPLAEDPYARARMNPDLPPMRQRDQDRRAFMASPDGVAYAHAVADWEAARAKEQEEADEMERLIAVSLEEPIELLPVLPATEGDL